MQTRRWTLLILVVALLLLRGGKAEAQARVGVPNLSLEVTMRDKQDSQVKKVLYLLNLECNQETCSLTTLSLNLCLDSGGRRTSRPVIGVSSTSDGKLSVKNLGDALEIEERLAFGKGTYRIGYEWARDGKSVEPWATSFSGATVESDPFNKKIATTEWVPLDGLLVQIQPACPFLLPGVRNDRK